MAATEDCFMLSPDSASARQTFRKLVFLAMLLLLLTASLSFGESAHYFYDESGRLIKVISSSGGAAHYEYDEVGNPTSIIRTGYDTNPPVPAGIFPQIVFVGKTVDFVISGEHLLTVRDVTTSNPGMVINGFSSTETSISINATILPNAAAGLTHFYIKTVFGSGAVPFRVGRLSFNHKYLAMLNGASAEITALLEGLADEYTIDLINSNRDVFSAPESITVPANMPFVFSIHSLSEGAGVLTAGNAGLSVYVTPPFSGPATSATTPFSVVIEAPLPVPPEAVSSGPFLTVPFSVLVVETPAPPPAAVSSGPFLSAPLSVLQSPPAAGGGSAAVNGGPFLSAPVSAIVEQP